MAVLGKPKRHFAVRVRKMGERRFLIRSNDVFELDPVGALIWELCDGDNTGDDIVARVVAAFPDAPPDVASRDVAEFLGQLLEAGLVAEAAG